MSIVAYCPTCNRVLPEHSLDFNGPYCNCPRPRVYATDTTAPTERPDSPTPETPTPLTDAMLDRLYERKVSVAQMLDEVEDHAESLERRLAASEQARREAEEHVADLAQEVLNGVQAIVPMESQLSTLRTTCDTMRAEVEAAKEQWRMSSVCREKQAEIDTLRAEVERLNKDVSTLQQFHLDAVHEGDALKSQLAAADGLAGALRDAVGRFRHSSVEWEDAAEDAEKALLAYQSAREGGGA